jgi:hypothetical protein
LLDGSLTDRPWREQAKPGARKVAHPACRTDALRYLRLSEMATCCSSVPGAWIEIDCWLATVLSASDAEMTPDTRTLIVLPLPLPSMLPPTPRVFSFQVPVTVPLL